MDTMEHLVDASREYGFGKLTPRMKADPNLQPKLYAVSDRQLASKGARTADFVAKQPHDAMLLLCLNHNRLLAPRTEVCIMANPWRSIAVVQSRS